MDYHVCPVCGYEKMLRPPASGYICPCCGVQFELDDDELSHRELRRRWIEHGMAWFSRATVPPVNWNPIIQLNDAGHEADLTQLYYVGLEDTEDYKKEFALGDFSVCQESEYEKYSMIAAAA